MNLSHQEITLDVNNKNTLVVNAHQGDAGTRFIDVTLTQNGEIIPMESTFTATAKASLYGMVKGVNKCVVDTEDNKIIVELTDTMLNTPGRLKMEITLTEGEEIITSQNFSVDVAESVLNGSTAIAENTDLAKLQRVILLVGELSKLENLDELMTKATTSYNRFKEYSGEEIDLNSGGITDTIVVNLSGCTVANAPVAGVVSGTVVNLSYKVNLERYIVQFMILRNNYTYKRNYTSPNLWSDWILVTDDLSKYLKTEDLQGLILSDTPSNTTTYNSNKIDTLLKGKIDTVSLRGADMTSVPSILTNVQKEGAILALYVAKLFDDDKPSVKTTFTGQKIDEMLSDKEDNSNKLTTGSPSIAEVQYPSLAYLKKFNYTKDETDSLLGGKAEKGVVDKNTFDLSMLMSSLVKKTTGNGIVNITNTAQNGVLKVSSDSDVTVKNQNMFENILIDGANIYNCNVSYDNGTGTYTVEYTGGENGSFYFGNMSLAGRTYHKGCGRKQSYNKDLSIRINCNEVTRLGAYITYYNADGIALTNNNIKVNTIYNIDEVENAEFFVIKIGFDYNPGLFTTGDIFHFSVQIEYGDTVSDFVVPLSNTDGLSYEGVTNIVGDGDISVEYVPDLRKICGNL